MQQKLKDVVHSIYAFHGKNLDLRIQYTVVKEYDGSGASRSFHVYCGWSDRDGGPCRDVKHGVLTSRRQLADFEAWFDRYAPMWR